MISPKIEQALNNQIKEEVSSSYVYLAIAAYFESINYAGFAKWMRVQSLEEYGHAMKIFDYVFQRNGRVELAGIETPQKEWASAKEAFEETLRHEQKISALINELVDLCIAEKDHATAAFLQWFVTEQIEEEATAQNILHSVTMLEKSLGGLFMLNRDLGKRGAKA